MGKGIKEVHTFDLLVTPDSKSNLKPPNNTIREAFTIECTGGLNNIHVLMAVNNIP